MAVGDLAAEDDGDLVGPTNVTVGIQKSLSQLVAGGAAGKNQVIAVFNLGEEEPGLTAGLLTLLVGEEGCERGQPFLAAGEQVFGGQRVRQFLQTGEVAALEKGLRRLFKIDVLLLEPVGEPVVLIQTEPGGERKIGRQAHEHPSPTGVVHLKVVLHDPALSHLQVPAVLLGIADGGHNPGRFPGFQNEDDLIGFGLAEVGFDEFVAPSCGWLDHRRVPFFRTILHPPVELVSDLGQQLAAHRELIAIGTEEADDALGLLEGLNQAVEQDAVEATIARPNAMLMVLVEGVHEELQSVSTPKRTPATPLRADAYFYEQGYQGRSPWLVSFRPPGSRHNSAWRLRCASVSWTLTCRIPIPGKIPPSLRYFTLLFLTLLK